MRYVGLLLFFLCIPVVASMLKSNPVHRRWAWTLLGAAPYVYGWAHLSVSIVSWAYWPGYVKGLLVALPDLLAIGLLLSTPKRRVRRAIPIALTLYIAAVMVSVAVSDLPFASFQYAWQLLRVLLVALAVARVSAGADAPRHIVYGMCYGITFQAFFSIVQRFGHGVVQASGTMGHQNLLGMMTHFALLTAIALMLAGDRARVLKLGAGAAMVVAALTGSRGAVGFAAMGVISLMALSLLRHPTAKKMRVASASVAILLALAPVAYLTLEKRFARSGSGDSGSNEERAAFERAARAMWADHPLGVGANEYVVTANTKGYSTRAGVIWNQGSRSANVHNVYLLIAAETGWPGLIAFVLLYAIAVLTALRAAWAKPYSRQRELLLGVGVALATVAMHNFYEWIFVVEVTQYLFAIMLGMAMGLGTAPPSRRQRLGIDQRRRQSEMVAAR